MYFEIVQQFIKTLTNLNKCIGKAVSDAETRKFDPNNYLTARLAPDMFPFTKQIQIACDAAKATASTLTGKEAPKHEDNETTMAQLQERIEKVTTYLKKFSEAELNAVTAKQKCKVSYPQGKAMYAQDFLVTRAIPNVYFHVSIAYALLRAGGAPIGKMDYLGDLTMFDA